MFQTASFWLVLALAIPLYWALPKRIRLHFLTLVSVAYLGLLVYMAEEWWFNAVALVGWTLLFYFLSPLTVRLARASGVGGPSAPAAPRKTMGRRVIFWLLVGGVLGYLCWFKYVWPHIGAAAGADNEVHTLLIPLGISYFVFKFVHYVIEVARGNIKDRSLVRFFCYIFLFPTFSEGPIERYDHFLANQKPRLTREAALQGMMRIIYGLIKKCILAEMFFGDFFAHTVEGQLLRELHSVSGFQVWRRACGLYVYEYFDFAGYTDIAIGACQLLGIGIMENFNWPILATNVSDFWKRWHMTLTGWCVTYIYMPVMGYTRRPNFATYVTFLVIAVWHAFSKGWLLWGLWQANGLVVYQAWARYKRRRKWTPVDLLIPVLVLPMGIILNSLAHDRMGLHRTPSLCMEIAFYLCALGLWTRYQRRKKRSWSDLISPLVVAGLGGALYAFANHGIRLPRLDSLGLGAAFILVVICMNSTSTKLYVPRLCLAIAITFLYLSAGELLTFGGVKEVCFFEHDSLHNLLMFGRKLIFLQVGQRDVLP